MTWNSGDNYTLLFIIFVGALTKNFFCSIFSKTFMSPVLNWHEKWQKLKKP